jgi:uncharacterized protein (TIGR03435 family)
MRSFSRSPLAAFAVLVVTATTGAHACGQTPGAPSFEVATVKPARNASAATNFGIAPNRFNAENATAKELIGFAYNVKTSNGIEGEPNWTASEKFDVDAKIGDAEAEVIGKLQPSQRIEEYRRMMQSLLAERFGLKTSNQTRELPVYALIAARNGPQLTQVDPTKQRLPMLWGGSKGELHAESVPMAFFADWISGSGDTDGRPVIDRTGLTGSYDFTLKWTRIEDAANAMGSLGTSQPTTGANPVDREGPSFISALREQLGLTLVPTSAPIQVLIIQSMEKPSQN